jgi:hypothetical protein
MTSLEQDRVAQDELLLMEIHTQEVVVGVEAAQQHQHQEGRAEQVVEDMEVDQETILPTQELLELLERVAVVEDQEQTVHQLKTATQEMVGQEERAPVSFATQHLSQLLHTLQEVPLTQNLVGTDITSGSILEQLYSKEKEWLILHD